MRTKAFCLALVAGLLSPFASAQWVQINGPPGEVPTFAVNGTNLYAGTYGGGVFLSTNNGTSWTEVNEGLPKSIDDAFSSFTHVALPLDVFTSG